MDLQRSLIRLGTVTPANFLTQLATQSDPRSFAAFAALLPDSPREVVGLAATHLSIDKDTVVARANELLGATSGSRSAEDLGKLWRALVAEFGEDSRPADVAGPPAAMTRR